MTRGTGECAKPGDARDFLRMQRPRREQEQQVASLVCLECGDESDEGRGWRAYVDDDELLVYCSCCADREFGS